MEQLNLFDDGNKSSHALPADIIDYRPGMFTQTESDTLLQKLIDGIPWTQRSVHMYGKEVITPRLTAWFGDDIMDYDVMGNIKPSPWTADLLLIRKRVEDAAGIRFNSVLLNFYRDGNDSVAWHDDQDGIPGKNKIVASVSLGQERMFDFRKKADHTIKHAILLENGSYLLMKGDFQQDWQHRIAKSTRPMKPRVNLTFRISGSLK